MMIVMMIFSFPIIGIGQMTLTNLQVKSMNSIKTDMTFCLSG